VSSKSSVSSLLFSASNSFNAEASSVILFVSHDRYFINQLANKVFDLNKDGGQLYLGDYQYFIEKTEVGNK
jgi:ATPase subunit of ABC transporter with duplicated ATPase domains